MIKNLFYLSLLLMIISWFLFFSTSFVPIKVYNLYISTNDNNLTSKIYRDIEQYIKSLNSEHSKYIILKKQNFTQKLIVKRNYDLIIIGTIEQEKFLKEKIIPVFAKKGFTLKIVPIENNLSLAYLSSYQFKPISSLDDNKLNKINEKFLDYVKENKMIDYIEYLKNYFSENDSKKIAEIQFLIFSSSISLLNFLLYPYTNSKTYEISSVEVNNIPNQEIYSHLQDLVKPQQKSKDTFIEVKSKVKVVNMRLLEKVSNKK